MQICKHADITLVSPGKLEQKIYELREVGNFEIRCVMFGIEEQVIGFQISVNDALVAEVLEAQC